MKIAFIGTHGVGKTTLAALLAQVYAEDGRTVLAIDADPAASLAYALLFWLAGNPITAMLTDIDAVRVTTAALMPLVVALPLVSVWCFLFDGVYIGATAAAAMMVTMGIAFAAYLAVLGPMTAHWGLYGLWGAVLVFMAARGLAQAAWYPRLEQRLG